MARPTEPCGLWQSEQDTRPSRIGWRDGRFTSARCTLWQAKHTSGWVSLSRTRSCAVCSLWQEEHETSFRSCVLPGQCMRSRPWWQVWQTSLFSVADILLKRFGIGLPLFRCSLGSPWQVAQPTIAIGERLSALVPCFPPQMSGASAWQVAQTLPSLISSADCASAVAGKNSTEQETKTAANSRAAGAATALSLFTSRLLHSSRRPPGRAAAGERTVREFASLGDRAILDQGLTLA